VASEGGLLEAKSMLAENIKRWEQELKSEGRREGRREGEAAVLRRLLQRRFGPLPEWAEQRLDVAESPTITGWTVRFLDARTLEDVFG
jgi:hypothetical protein